MPQSQQALAAKAIRKELKEAFKGVKFSVTSESFSMGDAVRVNWEDGPTDDQVKAITSKYQYGSFNGMEDMYENTNCNDDLPQSKYVSLSRDYSDGAKEAAIATIKEVDGITIDFEYSKCNYSGEMVLKVTDTYLENMDCYAEVYVRRYLWKIDFCAIEKAVEIVEAKKENSKKLDVIFEEMDEMKVELFDTMDDLFESTKVEPVDQVTNISVSCGNYSGVTYDFR